MLLKVLWLALAAAATCDARGAVSYRLQRMVTPVSFYGYSRPRPSIVGVMRAAVISAPRELSCPARLTVRVHKAMLSVEPVAEGQDRDTATEACTELIRAKCLHRQTCQVSPDECKAHAQGETKRSKRLTLQYSCEPDTSPKPLYNGTAFVDGVLQQFVRLSGRDAKADESRNSTELRRALQRCLKLSQCNYVTCEDAGIHTDDYFASNNRNTCAYLKPDQFKLPGYAVFPNYTGMCSRPIPVKSRDFYEVAKAARSQAWAAFTIAYQSTSQFNINHGDHAWICRSMPTIVPMAGHVLAVPAV